MIEVGMIDADALVRVAKDVHAGSESPVTFLRTFEQSTVFVPSVSGPTVQVLVSDLKDKGRWVPAFSSLLGLDRHSGGPCSWIGTTGADLLANLPDGIGILLDPQDKHRMALPPKLPSEGFADVG